MKMFIYSDMGNKEESLSAVTLRLSMDFDKHNQADADRPDQQRRILAVWQSARLLPVTN